MPTRPPMPQEARQMVEWAIADVQGYMGLDHCAVKVLSVKPELFSDASLGRPEPGVVYAQVPTQGYVMTLEGLGERFVFHAAGGRLALVDSTE